MRKLGSALHPALPLAKLILPGYKFRFRMSLTSFGCSNADNQHLQHAINLFNDQVSTSDAISAGVSTNPDSQ